MYEIGPTLTRAWLLGYRQIRLRYSLGQRFAIVSQPQLQHVAAKDAEGNRWTKRLRM